MGNSISSWSTSSNIYTTSATSNGIVTVTVAPPASPPEPKTEVQRLLAEVDAVAALGRAS